MNNALRRFRRLVRRRAGSEQMRGRKRVILGRKGEECRKRSVRAQSSALFLFAGCTTAPTNGIGLQPPRWRRQEWCSPAFNTVRSASVRERSTRGHMRSRRHAAHTQRPGGIRTCLHSSHQRRNPPPNAHTLVASSKNTQEPSSASNYTEDYIYYALMESQSPLTTPLTSHH